MSIISKRKLKKIVELSYRLSNFNTSEFVTPVPHLAPFTLKRLNALSISSIDIFVVNCQAGYVF